MANKDAGKEEMAEYRTDLAEDRTVLANERTFNSWMGTALGSLGLAVGLLGVFGETEPTWLAQLAASIFVLLSMSIVIMGYKKATATEKKLSTHMAETTADRQKLLIASTLIIGGATIGIILWVF